MNKRWTTICAVAALAILVVGTGAATGQRGGSVPAAATGQLDGRHVSSSILMRYWSTHPDRAPESVAAVTKQYRSAATSSTSAAPAPKQAVPPGLVDFSAIQGTGYPQSGTSVAECTNTTSGAQYVVGSANDYAGSFGSSNQNVSDFSFSGDGGATFAKGGRFGNVVFSDSTSVPTNGDPAVASPSNALNDGNCFFWLAGQALSSDMTHSGVFVARTSAATLAGTCSTADSCFPTKQLVVQSVDPSAATLHDSVALAIGNNAASGARGVGVADTLLTSTGSSIELTLCTPALAACGTSTIDGEVASSSGDFDAFPSIAWTPSGAMVVSWAYYDYGATDAAGLDKLTVEIRDKSCVPSGATAFSCGATNVVTRETMPLADATASLKDATWQVGTAPKVNQIGNRLFDVWDACGDGSPAVVNDTYGRCDDSRIRYSYSSDGGSTWSTPGIVAAGPGQQFQPSKPQQAGTKLVVGYVSTGDALALTGRNIGYDEYVASGPYAGTPSLTSTRITASSNWPSADWWQLAPQSIGDYQGVVANGNNVWLDFTDNYLDECIGKDVYNCTINPASQQDAFLYHLSLG